MIVIKNVTLRRGAKIVLHDTSVTLQPGEKIGLVGRLRAGHAGGHCAATGYHQSV